MSASIRSVCWSSPGRRYGGSAMPMSIPLRRITENDNHSLRTPEAAQPWASDYLLPGQVGRIVCRESGRFGDTARRLLQGGGPPLAGRAGRRSASLPVHSKDPAKEDRKSVV